MQINPPPQKMTKQPQLKFHLRCFCGAFVHMTGSSSADVVCSVDQDLLIHAGFKVVVVSSFLTLETD